MFRRPSDMRSRLTLSYLAVVALALGGVCLGSFVVVYRPLRNQLDQFAMEELQRRLLMSMLVSVPAVLVVAGIAGYALARRALSPIEHMSLRARGITPETLGQRFPNHEANDELGSLARALNDTLTRIERAFEQLRRFTSDFAHDLRTPLAMIRSVGEVGLQKTLTPEGYRHCIGSMLEEIDRLTSLLESLLMITRADTGNAPLQRVAVGVMAVAREAASLYEVLVEEKSLKLVLDGDERAEAEADRLLLKRALVNILHNAVKYSPDGETIVVRVLNRDAAHVTVEVEDHGPGIPPDDQVKVFERFYRSSRTREGDPSGAGLGLAIAKWAVEANGGTIGLVSANGQGCTFWVTLPRPGA
jgi:heavy metal sensor kinase